MSSPWGRRFKLTYSENRFANHRTGFDDQFHSMASKIPQAIPTEKGKTSSLPPLFPHIFAGTTIASLALYQWPLRWLISGAPALTYVLLLGVVSGYRILPFANVWTLIGLLNLVYAVSATSWLLYWVFASACYPSIFLACLFQFDLVAKFVRRRLRHVLRELQFTNDKIAFFNLPALEIDVDVEGLMCIRGITISVSTLTIIAHGVEVGIKFSDDMELSIVTDKVRIALFRRIDIGDVYANLKGGEWEMTFGNLAKKTKSVGGEPMMVTDTPLLVAAAINGDTSSPTEVTMADRMTNGKAPDVASIRSGFASVQGISPDDNDALEKYQAILDHIERTSAIYTARMEAEESIRSKGQDEAEAIIQNGKNLRAAICSALHDKPTVAHPAKRAIKVSMIKSVYPKIRRFLHRFPLLLRAQLNPIAYFHPIYVTSITAGGSGKWVQHMLSEMVFKDYAEEGAQIRRLKQRISAWLADANFVFEMGTITGLANVPMNTAFDIMANLKFDDIVAHRTLPKEVDLMEIIRLGGADATIKVPSFLLPHHEHILPPPPTKEEVKQYEKEVDDADGQPKTIQAQNELEQLKKDETNVSISAHVRLPACFDQSLLDFIAALVKATKIIEFFKEDNPPEKEEVHGFRNHARQLKADMNSKMQRVAVDAAANDKWIAKLVGKITRNLETMQGDIGYSGDLPVPLDPYRRNAESATKIMP